MNCIVTNYTASPTYDIPFPCNSIVGSDNALGGGIAYMAYGYLLNKASVYAFLILFSILCLGHIGAAAYHRILFCFFTFVPGAILEVLGWAGRFWSWHTTFWDQNQGGQWDNNGNGFTMQICCLIIGPTFFSAANYLILGRLIRTTGGRYSSVSARSFSVLFTLADVLCLIVQGIGGGVTGSANTDVETKNGLHIMAIGVVIQLVLTLIYIAFLAEYVWRFRTDHPSTTQLDLLRPFDVVFRVFRRKSAKRVDASQGSDQSIESLGMQERSKSGGPSSTRGQSTPGFLERGAMGGRTGPLEMAMPPASRVNKMLLALSTSTMLLVARGIYRCVELLDFKGVNSGAYADQGLFLGMDAALMSLLLTVQLVFHPGLVVGRHAGAMASGTIRA